MDLRFVPSNVWKWNYPYEYMKLRVQEFYAPKICEPFGLSYHCMSKRKTTYMSDGICSFVIILMLVRKL